MNGQLGKNDETKEAGFTLVEVLVSLTLFSLLSLVVLGALQFGAKAWARAAQQSDLVDHAAAARTALRRLLENAYPYYITNDPTRSFVDFQGDPGAMRFLTSATLALGSGGQTHVTLAVASKGSHKSLVLSAVPELATRTDAEGSVNERMLVGRAETISFSYFGKAGRDAAPAWHERWNGQSALPLLIRIRVGLEPWDHRSWSDFVVAPRRTADVGCVYDALGRRCRGR